MGQLGILLDDVNIVAVKTYGMIIWRMDVISVKLY